MIKTCRKDGLLGFESAWSASDCLMDITAKEDVLGGSFIRDTYNSVVVARWIFLRDAVDFICSSRVLSRSRSNSV